MEKFAIGLAMGALIGAAVVANSQKTRKLFVKSQDEIKNKLDDMIDEKLEMLDDEDDDEDEPRKPKKKSKR